MAVTLFVGNLPYSIGDAELQEIFSTYATGELKAVVKRDPEGRSRGFGFVTFDGDDAENNAQSAIDQLNGAEVNGRTIKVDMQRPREEGYQPRRFNNNREGGYNNSRNYGSRRDDNYSRNSNTEETSSSDEE